MTRGTSSSKEFKEYARSRVRAVLVSNPGASLRQIKTALAKSKNPLDISVKTIQRHVHAIRKDRTMRNNWKLINERIGEIQDKKEQIDQMLWAIAADPNEKTLNRIAAMRELMENEKRLLQSEMDAGIFERKLGTLTHIPAAVDPAKRAEVVEAMVRFGIIKKAKTIETEAKQIAAPKQKKKK